MIRLQVPPVSLSTQVLSVICAVQGLVFRNEGLGCGDHEFGSVQGLCFRVKRAYQADAGGSEVGFVYLTCARACQFMSVASAIARQVAADDA